MADEALLLPHERPVVEVRHVGTALVVRLLAPDVTSTYAHRLRAFLFNLADCGLPLLVILDLDEWPGISSQLPIFLRFVQSVTGRGGGVRLCHLTRHAAKVLTVTKLDLYFAVFPDLDAAVAGWES